MGYVGDYNRILVLREGNVVQEGQGMEGSERFEESIGLGHQLRHDQAVMDRSISSSR